MPDNSVSNKRIAKNSIFLSMRMVIVMIISLYTSRVILKTLGVEDYGVYNVVCGFVAMFAFLNTSMSNGIQRFYNFELGKNGDEGANKVYVTSLLIQLLLGVIIIILTESFGIWYLHSKMVIPECRMAAAEWIFQLSMVGFLVIIMQVPYTAAVMAHEKMDFYAVMSILDCVVKLGLVIFLPYLDCDKLIAFGIINLIINILNLFLYYCYCKKEFKEITLSRKRNIEKSMFKSMLGFSSWNIFGSFSNMMRDQGINLILNFFYGPIVNAARGVAMQVNGAINNLLGSVLTPVRPQVIQSYARNELDRSMRLTFSISKFSLFFMVLLALPICVEMNYILHLWLGNVVPEHTQMFCIIILATTAILIPMGALATLVHASGKMVKYQLIGSTVKILSVPIAFVLMQIGCSPEWALISVLIFDAIGFFVGMFIIKTIMPFSIGKYITDVLIPILPVFIISLFVELMIHQYVENNIIRLLSVLVIGTIVSTSIFYSMAITKDEKLLLNGMFMGFIKRRTLHQ
jgi:O-antigen/teichoic acid export membrane protein